MASVLHAALLLGVLGEARRRLDVACVDDPDWHIGSSPHKNCGFLSRFEWEDGDRKGRLCAKKGWLGADRYVGYEACPVACGLCDAGEEDSTTWYATGKPKNDCDWIGKNPDARCGKKDADTKVEAWCAARRAPFVRPPVPPLSSGRRLGTPAPRPAAASTTTTRPRRASRTFTTTSRTTSTADPTTTAIRRAADAARRCSPRETRSATIRASSLPTSWTPARITRTRTTATTARRCAAAARSRR